MFSFPLMKRKKFALKAVWPLRNTQEKKFWIDNAEGKYLLFLSRSLFSRSPLSSTTTKPRVAFVLVLSVLLHSKLYSQDSVVQPTIPIQSVVVPELDGGPCAEYSKKFSLLDRLEALAKETRKPTGRWFLAEYDFDNRGYNVMHFMGHSPLPFGMSVWGFIDLEGLDQLGANREDIATYFLEIDVKKPLFKSGGLIAEVNDLQGDGNTIGRFGVFLNPSFFKWESQQGIFAGKGRVGFKIFPFETDGRGCQVSMNWNRSFSNILDGRLSAGGFIDLNTKIGPNNDLVAVTEHQIRYRLFEGLHVITEFRVNEFLQDDFGIAPGLQYRF